MYKSSDTLMTYSSEVVMADVRSSLHSLALSFNQLSESGETHDVVVFEIDENGQYSVQGFGTLKALHGGVRFGDLQGNWYYPLGLDTNYHGWRSSSLITLFDAEDLGLKPCDDWQLSELDDETLRLNGKVRDPQDSQRLWSTCFTVRRDVANQVLGCTTEELARLLDEYAARMAILIEEEENSIEEAWEAMELDDED